MAPEKLIRMANQIATFFETSGGENPASEVADHLNKFWDPRMRKQLLHIAQAGGTGLHPLVIEAVPGVSVGAVSAS